MLEFYFSYRGVLKRLRSGALGAEMDRIAGDLHSQGYKPASAKLYLSRIARFSHFAAERCGSEPISATIVDRYLRTLGDGSPRIAAVTALQHARRVAPDRFMTAVASVVDDPDAALLSSFSDYLSKVRGLEPKSRDGALLGARRFLQWFRIRHPGQDLGTLTAQQVLAAVEHQLSLSAASEHAHGGNVSHPNVSPLSALGRSSPSRSCTCRSKNAPLAVGPFAAASYPGQRFAAPSMRSAGQRRSTFAIGPSFCCSPRQAFATASCALFSSRISTGEPAKSLSGARRASATEWPRFSRRPALRLPTTSCGRDRRSIVRICSCRSRAPVGPLKYAAPVSRIVRKRLRCSGIELGRVGGAHLLRHSLATELVEQRRPINEIADLLGHRSINTTALYVKVATSQLADVALPFPGGAA